MSRQPSDATLLKRANSDVRMWKKRWMETQTELNNYRARATKAEQEAADWRRRFDILLTRSESTSSPLPAEQQK